MAKLTKNNSFCERFPLLVEEWNYDKNGDLRPEDLSYGSEKMVWWTCKKCGYEWKTPLYYRTTKKSNNCFNCNSLLSKDPELSLEWNYKKNGNILPQGVHFMGSDKVWWKCKICSHEWMAQIYQRTTPKRKTGCPKCKRKRTNKINSLAVLNPNLSREWNHRKNHGLTPHDFTVNSHKMVWWICNVCGYEWQEVINNRNTTGNKCFRCRSLATKNPDLAKEWHPTKNDKLTPYNVSVSSHQKVWWKCLSCNHEWVATPLKRNDGTCNCPSCTKIVLKNGVVCDSFPEAYMYLQYKKSQIKFIHNKKYGNIMGNRRYDFYLVNDNKYIEVTSFNKNSINKSWVAYLKNIVIKKQYVEKILGAKFQFIQFVPSGSQVNFVRKNMKNH